MITLETLAKLAYVLNCNIGDLVQFEYNITEEWEVSVEKTEAFYFKTSNLVETHLSAILLNYTTYSPNKILSGMQFTAQRLSLTGILWEVYLACKYSI